MNTKHFAMAGAGIVITGILLVWSMRPGEPKLQPESAPAPRVQAGETARAARPADSLDRQANDRPANQRSEGDFFDRVLAPSGDPEPTPPTAGLYPRKAPVRSVAITTAPAKDAPHVGESKMELDLEPGVREPVAFFVTEDEFTPVQANALAAITDAALERVEQAAKTNASAENLAKVWAEAQAEADASYRNIFGESALHQRGTEAAVRALGYPMLPAPASEPKREGTR